MKPAEITEVLANVRFADWTFHVDKLAGTDHLYLQVRFRAADNDAPGGEPTLQKGRKFLLSEHMTESEIVQTALLAVRVAQGHELREQFTYRRRAVFGPHFDVAALAALVDRGAFDLRTPPLPEPPTPPAPPAPRVEIKPPVPLTRDALTADAVRASLRSCACPACGGHKASGMTFCVGCWGRLPQQNQSTLTVICVGHGYEEALFDALEFLGAGAFHVGGRS